MIAHAIRSDPNLTAQARKLLGQVAHVASKPSMLAASAQSQEPWYVDSCASEHDVRQGDPSIVVGSECSCPAKTVETANGDVFVNQG